MEVLLFLVLFFFGGILFGLFVDSKEKAESAKKAKKIESDIKINRQNKTFYEKHEFMKGLALVKLADNCWSYILPNGNFLNTDIYYSAEDFNNETVIVNDRNRGYNIMDSKGNYKLPFGTGTIKRIIPEYYSISFRSERQDFLTSLRTSKMSNYEYYIVKGDGSYLSYGPFSSEPKYVNGCFKVEIGEETLKINKNSEFVNTFFRSWVHVGSHMCKVKDSNNKYGLYDLKSKKLILQCTYQNLLYYEPEQICLGSIKDNNLLKYFAMKTTGEFIISPCLNEMSICDSKYILLEKKEFGLSYYGIATFQGEVIFPPNYNSVFSNEDGSLFFALTENKCMVADKNGVLQSEYSYDYYGKKDILDVPVLNLNAKYRNEKCIPTFSTQILFIVVNNFRGKKGVLSLNNEIVIPTVFDDIIPVENEDNTPVAVFVEKDNLWGMYSLTGQELIPVKYYKIDESFENDDYTPFYDSDDPFSREYKIEKEMFRGWCAVTKRIIEAYRTENDFEIYNLDGSPYVRNKEHRISDSKPSYSHQLRQATQNNGKNYYLFFDTETTGIPKNYDKPSSDIYNWPRLVQLAWILEDANGKILHKYNFIVKPENFIIPDNATKIHGITTETAIKEGLPLEKVIGQFKEDFNQATVVVGHNVNFDKKIVGAELIRLGQSDIMDSKISYCTMLSSSRFCNIQDGFGGYKYPKLQELYKKLFGVEFNDAHDAMKDIEATEKCFWELKKRNLI